MNLEDVIKNLTQTKDIISEIKDKIKTNVNILENNEKQLNLNENKIQSIVNINIMK